MTEAEWLGSDEPLAMLDFLEGRPSDRKFRLCACAACRRFWSWFDEDEASRAGVVVAERYADGEAGEAELAAAHSQLSESFVYGATRPRADGIGGTWGVIHSTVAALLDSYDDFEAAGLAGKAERVAQAGLIRDVFGSPFYPATVHPIQLTATVKGLATVAYEERSLPSGDLDPARLAVLADALEDSGCTDPEIVGHLRSPGPHVRGCWALDLVLGKQ